MKIVIEMAEEKYEWIKKNNPNAKPDSIVGAVVHGTPLPKGHGRLIDADALNFNADYNEPLISKFDFDCAPTIIEADKGEET